MSNFEYMNCPVCMENNCRRNYKIDYISNATIEKLNLNFSIPDIYVYVCKNCNHHYSNPKISDSLLSEYYSNLNSVYYDLVPDEDFLNNEHDKIFKLVSKYIKGGTILEIGCGFGFLLDKFPNNQWKKFGLEPSTLASDFAIKNFNLNIYNNYLNDSVYKSSSFDVIMLFDVIEHLNCADSMIKLINYYLKENGIVVIGTGNISSLNAIISKQYWSYFSHWEHISFFSPSSIEYLLSKNGFEILSIKKVPYWKSTFINFTIFLKNIFYIRIKNLIKFLLNFIANKKINYSYYDLAFDHMIVVASKNKKNH